MEAHAVVDANPFVPAREHFESLVARLDGEETRRMTHADVERLLRPTGLSCFGGCSKGTSTPAEWARRREQWSAPTGKRGLTRASPTGRW